VDLARFRQATRWKGYKCIGDYHAGAYECDFVSPYTKTAGNIDAEIMIVLQDWASDDFLRGPFSEDSAKLGHSPHYPTNQNLSWILKRIFGLTLRDTYGTNLFPFVKLGGMSAGSPQADLLAAARQFTLPEIRIVNPKLVVCLGLNTFNALRQACGLSPCYPLAAAIDSSFNVGSTRVWCQAHTGALGQNNRNKGGIDRVSQDWRRMKADMQRVVTSGLKRERTRLPLKRSAGLPVIMENREMIVYFNNSRNKRHAELYGKGAFFDLWASDERARRLSAGQKCIVASQGLNKQITFDWYSFLREAHGLYEGKPSRVFYGDLIKTETHTKADANRIGPYSTFFDKNGNFKRPAVIR
jgi:uracil-DNA glycosylase